MTDKSPAAYNPTPEEQAEFDKRLAQATEKEDSEPVEQMIDGQRVVWAPQAGSQTAFMECPLFECLFHGTRGNGKLQPLDSMVKSFQGWKRMGDLKVGDLVQTPKGHRVPITHIFEHSQRDIYRVTFDDGATCEAGDEHLWKFTVPGYSLASAWFLADTLAMKACLDSGWSVFIPTVEPLPMPQGIEASPLDAYLLGLWLDGNKPVLPPKLFDGVRKPRSYRAKPDAKFIPDIYKDAPIDVRVAVIQGLLTDAGGLRGNKSALYSTTSGRLAADMQYVVRSLGAKCRMEEGGGAYRLFIQTAGKFDLFRCVGKWDRVTKHTDHELRRQVTTIEYIGKKDARCIHIDDVDHLYITDDFIVTHNTDSLLMTYAQYVGRGYGEEWAGVIFRQTYPQLADVQAKSEKWFRQIFPGAKFNHAKMMWTWPTGERLLFRHMARPDDYWKYHGAAFPFVGWEELTNWVDDQCFKRMFACCRSSVPGIPRMVRATTNSYGAGHQWCKERYQLTGKWWLTNVISDAVDKKGRPEPIRCSIYGHIDENKILLAADPLYKQAVAASASNPAMAEAWLDGSWDIVAGGMFEDVWNPKYNIVPRFNVPKGWIIDRSFDWGSSAPFSVGWWAESDGSDLMLSDGRIISTVRGDLFRIKEWYGWNGEANKGLRYLAVDIAKEIVEREIQWGWREFDAYGDEILRAKPGPADSSIFDIENGVSIGNDMEKHVRVGSTIHKGVYWTRADKRPGSRKTGWEAMRKMMKAAHLEDGLPREKPGLFVVGDECSQFLRTVLSLPRDERDMDDVDTNAEDHIGDEVRYRIRACGMGVGSGTHIGAS